MKRIYLFLLPFIMISCDRNIKTQTTKSDFQNISLTPAQKTLVQANNQFAFNLLKSACKNEIKENLLYSPLSAGMVLCMVMNGAEGNTKTGLINTLGYGNVKISSINNYYKLMSQQLPNIDHQVDFNIANFIWHRNSYSISSTFLSTNQKYYFAQVASLDFSSPAVINTINNWVSAKTDKEITNISNDISPNQMLYLVNATYFKGLWIRNFNKSKTTDKDFLKENKKVVRCNMMTQENYFPFYSNDIFNSIEMDYGQGNYTMTILLPQKGKVVSDVIGYLSSERWKTLSESFSSELVRLNMPRFNVSYETSLNDILSKMGMADAFKPGIANFHGINSNGGIYISELKHKTKIRVDEEGTVAVASTQIEVSILSNETPKVLNMNINKPFVFVITEKSTGTILFIGRIMDTTE